MYDETTWKKMLEYEMRANDDSWENIVHIALPEGCSLEEQFDAGYGGPEGCRFTVWTHSRVYFPTVYDGAEGVASVPREPCDVPTGHVGGW